MIEIAPSAAHASVLGGRAEIGGAPGAAPIRTFRIRRRIIILSQAAAYVLRR
jgi:hypothetical protein